MIQIIFLSIILSFLSYKNEVLANDSVNVFTAPRIVGGSDAGVDTCKYQTQVRYRGAYLCSACFISDDGVLTAAHCFTDHPRMKPPYRKHLTVHTNTLSSEELGIVHRVEEVTLHPQFTGTWDTSLIHDIAYIKLKDKIEFDEYTQPVELPTQNIIKRTTGIMSGWGRLDANANAPSPLLKVLEMMIINYKACNPFMVKTLYKEQLCAFHSKGNGCSKGDSGGPLVKDNVLIGIHSWIRTGMCGEGQPEVFTNVYAERAFIDSVRFSGGGSTSTGSC